MDCNPASARVRIVHVSDLHYAPKTLKEVDRCMDVVVDHIQSRPVDAVVISGDSTDHALDAHAPALAALLTQVRRLADQCPVLMLQGTFSHEPVGLLRVMALLGGRHPVYVADRIGQVALTAAGQWHPSSGWCFNVEDLPPQTVCVFSCLPSLNRAVIAAPSVSSNPALRYSDAIAQVLAGFSVVNAQLSALGLPTIGISHGTVNGCLTEHGVPMASLDHEFSVGALFAAQTSAFLLGHIHRHQAWMQAGRHIAYAGSPARLHFGEMDEKGFLLWEVGAQTACFEFIPTPAHRMLHFDFAGAPDVVMLQAHAEAAQGACVRIRWHSTEDTRHGVDRTALHALFERAELLKLEEQIHPIQRTRAGGIAQAATLPEKLSRWAQVSGVDAAPLLDRLHRLLGHEPDAVLNVIRQSWMADERLSQNASHDAA